MTTPDFHKQASDLFLELREMNEQERSGRLAALDSRELRREVEELLANDVHTGTDPDAAAEEERAQRPDDVPAAIGPYKVLRRLGRGGSGFVLLAEQERPIHRLVAIKVVPYAAINPDAATRFEFERRALERTEHPNIAKILDAGRTADGLPYLVIEYVEGVPLSQYCRANRLSVRECIGLVVEIADAVQHAHQRGVIHRDLKPANILVSETSGRPTPRILDFGIAKPTQSFGADALVTSGVPIGTPAYMAPEQTGGRATDTRADVYALGAVLYSLVAGRPPIDTSGEPVELLARIRDQVPPAASRVRGAMNPQPDVPREALPRSFWHDLDLILGKTLEKDPARRYETVAAFAEDLRRLLRREAIAAHPPTFRYRASRFAQRHRALVATVSVVSAAAVLGIGGLTAGLIEAHRQRAEAKVQSEAQQEVITFLREDLLGAASPTREGEKITAADLLQQASERVGTKFENRPLVAAAIHFTLGTAFADLGEFGPAERHLDLSLDLRRKYAGVNAPDTVRSEVAKASFLARSERYELAETALRAAVERARAILGVDDPAYCAALTDLGGVVFTVGRGKEAIGILKEALTVAIRVHGDRSPRVLETTSNLAQAYDMAGDAPKSLELLHESLRIAESLKGVPRLTLIGLNNNIGATYQGMNRDEEAAPYLRRASELAAEWFSVDNPDRWVLQANLASLEAELGNADRGAELYAEVVQHLSRIMGPSSLPVMRARHMHANALWIGRRFEQAAAEFTTLLPEIREALGAENYLTIQTRASLARVLFDAGQFEQALPHIEQAAAEFVATLGESHPRTQTAQQLLRNTRMRLEASRADHGGS
ncbi:MAG: serine/threonine protein kinase [Phycisphaeraceae bacterium]|nr:serine/threonine protein kinase [Phycisphaeraceae bacterium]